jgi:hypothetical protein
MFMLGSENASSAYGFMSYTQNRNDDSNTCNINGIGDHIPNYWILLDNQSTINIFSNALLLRNICESDTWMKTHSTGSITHKK